MVYVVDDEHELQDDDGDATVVDAGWNEATLEPQAPDEHGLPQVFVAQGLAQVFVLHDSRYVVYGMRCTCCT